MKRKICVITGTRADYGLLRWVIEEVHQHDELDLQIIATGTHLSPEFGLTFREIERDGFTIDRKVEVILSSDTSMGVSKSMGLGMIGLGEALNQLSPDWIVVLGDRFEIFVAAAAATVSRIPIAHLHGGEVTEGAYDDVFRHSITKMAHLHFVAHTEYLNRVIQLGEQPGTVFNVGGLGIDNVCKLNLLGRQELESTLDLRLNEKNLVVTFHPTTLEANAAAHQMHQLLSALKILADTCLIFTISNADNESRILIRMLERFVDDHPNAYLFKSLGQVRYLSLLQHVDGVIGNSSSGLMEAPSFNKGTVNIGNRQRGRLKADSVIDCLPEKHSISDAIRLLYSEKFQASLHSIKNPYGNGGASERVVRILAQHPIEGILKKSFFDIKF